MCGNNGRLLVREALKNFRPRCDHGPHKSHVGLITCIDARIGAGIHYDGYGDHALRITEIASVIPPYAVAPINTRAKFSFQKLKDIDCVKIEGHSFCGGAQTAFAHPTLELTPNEDVATIVESVAQSGADLPRLRDAFMRACEGDEIKGANLMSRELLVRSVGNILTFPGVNERIMRGDLDVVAVYHSMKVNEPDTPSHLERYDVAHQRWIYMHEDDVVTNMCTRSHGCAQCTSCHNTIGRSLEWVKHPVAGGGEVEVPYHIAALLRERMAYYQPRLAQQWERRRDHGHLPARHGAAIPPL